ncbi:MULTISPECIES: hypothetical protein [Cyclobacteriaceae]|uniref:DUF3945 domain-containing protein n=2 Tax=Cyclobacteriaceae TaxID=563798 RepID=A0ABV9T0B6_9BACT
MEQKNLEFLKDKLKYSGFDPELIQEMEKQIEKGLKEFQLQRTMEIEGSKVDFNLHFNKSDTSEMYFFNKTDVTLNPTMENGAAVNHTFYQNQNISAKEAFNLLQGRAVNKTLFNKEGHSYQAWLQLDLKEKDKNNNYTVNQYHENYGYNLKDLIGQLPVKLDERQGEWLEKSLQKGNRHGVAMEMDGKKERIYVEANPQYKTLNFYDQAGKRISKDDLKVKMEHPGTKQSTGQKQEPAKQEKKNDEGSKKKTAPKVNQRSSVKKKPSKKKGVGI